MKYTLALIPAALLILCSPFLQAQQSDTSSYFPLGLWGIWIDKDVPHSPEV